MLLFTPTQGGIGPAGLSAEDLHVLDLTQQRPRWHRFEFEIFDSLFFHILIVPVLQIRLNGE